MWALNRVDAVRLGNLNNFDFFQTALTLSDVFDPRVLFQFNSFDWCFVWDANYHNQSYRHDTYMGNMGLVRRGFCVG